MLGKPGEGPAVLTVPYGPELSCHGKI